MKLLSSLLLGLSLATSSVLAHPLDLPFEISLDEFQKRQSGIVVTNGVKTGTAGPQQRLEIRQMLNTKPNQWTLFILAMQQFQAQAQTSSTSYYQIAGIHGVPQVNYNNVKQCGSCSGTDGYCTHDMILFPAWHRAYLALFEQEFIAVVNSIANSWPTSGAPTSRVQMTGAAATMRLPYWDWAAHPAPGLNTFPTVMSESQITINGPTGVETINNPLFRHDFSDPSGLVYSPFINWGVTLRYPNSDAATATSQEGDVTSAFNNIRSSLQDQIYQMFTSCTDFLSFSNDASGTAACPNSLEGIHNTVHTNTGGGGSSTVSGGHMNYLSLAAFDPAFWLHHANVDRYFALWQALHPNAYSATQNAPHNTWTIASGTGLTMDSPLTPFVKDAGGDFWTPNQVRNWNTTFNYDYPEFAHGRSSAVIASYVNKLYGPSATATAGSSKRTAMPEPVAADAVPTPSAALTAGNGSLFQYVANIKTPRYALNGSYNVYLFLGNPASEDASTWVHDPALVGPLGVLAQTGMNMTQGDILVYGGVPLTRSVTAAVQNGTITDLTEACVAPYLKKELQWRIQGPNGTEVNPDSIPSFELGVYASTSTQPADESCLPEWSEFFLLEEITQGKAGGVGSAGNGGGFIGSNPSASTIVYGSSSAADYTVTNVVTSSTTLCPETESSTATAVSSSATVYSSSPITSAPTLSITSSSASDTAYSSA